MRIVSVLRKTQRARPLPGPFQAPIERPDHTIGRDGVQPGVPIVHPAGVETAHGVTHQVSRPLIGNKENRAEGKKSAPNGKKPRRETTSGAVLGEVETKSDLPRHLGEPIGCRDTWGRLSTEFVLLNLHGGQPMVEAHDTPSGDQLESTLVIQLGGPANGQFDAAPRPQNLRSSKQHAGTGHIHGFAFAGLLATPFVQGAKTDFALNREPVRTPAVGILSLLWPHVSPRDYT